MGIVSYLEGLNMLQSVAWETEEREVRTMREVISFVRKHKRDKVTIVPAHKGYRIKAKRKLTIA